MTHSSYYGALRSVVILYGVSCRPERCACPGYAQNLRCGAGDNGDSQHMQARLYNFAVVGRELF